jgi:hypothetical protein
LRKAEIVGFLDRLWKAIGDVQFSDRHVSGPDPENVRQRAQAIAPVVWLLGKTGAKKSAIVAALTGDPYAKVGEGFEPCTRTAAFYDVPPEVPLLRFLDTRGLGEADYDPAKDIASDLLISDGSDWSGVIAKLFAKSMRPTRKAEWWRALRGRIERILG